MAKSIKLTNANSEHLFAEGTICDIGTNANGMYIKWTNGLMICCKKVTFLNVPVATAFRGGGYISSVLSLGNYPAEFIEPPTISFSVEQNISSNKRTSIVTLAELGTGICPPRLFIHCDTANDAFEDFGYCINLISFGKWK